MCTQGLIPQPGSVPEATRMWLLGAALVMRRRLGFFLKGQSGVNASAARFKLSLQGNFEFRMLHFLPLNLGGPQRGRMINFANVAASIRPRSTGRNCAD